MKKPNKCSLPCWQSFYLTHPPQSSHCLVRTKGKEIHIKRQCIFYHGCLNSNFDLDCPRRIRLCPIFMSSYLQRDYKKQSYHSHKVQDNGEAYRRNSHYDIRRGVPLNIHHDLSICHKGNSKFQSCKHRSKKLNLSVLLLAFIIFWIPIPSNVWLMCT